MILDDKKLKDALESQNPWWFGERPDNGIDRIRFYDIEKYIKAGEIFLILGVRRSGKSTFLYQIINNLDTDPRRILFMNMDEPIFQSKSSDPSFLTDIVKEYVEKIGSGKLFLIIDEIQNYEYWPSAIKSIYDFHKNVKIILTGSNSSLIWSSAARKLSGRSFHMIMYPLSFVEFLHFKNIPLNSSERKLEIELGNYLEYGSFPRVVLEDDIKLKHELLKSYFQTIYLKDITHFNKIRGNRDVFELLFLALSNIGTPLSYSRIAKAIGISVNTAKEYLGYAEDSYLLHQVSKFDYSLRKQTANPRKIYCIDTGMANAVSFRFSENKGWLLENAVFMELKRQGREVYYHKNQHECDFVIKEGTDIAEAIQVSFSLENEATRKRELKGLMEALRAYNLDSGIIITSGESGRITIENKTIKIVPFYKWAMHRK
ncbi:MAG: ATP-binding protein [Candidatus Micrarchaeota archaeon]|nr:ATP-binding protein [Candidatus Micrarchaeota archaeon]